MRELTRLYRHSVNSKATITRLAFSPRDNLIAWMDTEGVFSRWDKAVPNNFPDPVKTSVVANSSATVPSHQNTGPNLFVDGDTTSAQEPEKEDVDLDAGFGDVDEDWIIDDLGGGLKDAPATTSGMAKDGFVKEMGEILSFVWEVLDSSVFSQHHQSSASLSTRIDADGEPEEISWYV